MELLSGTKKSRAYLCIRIVLISFLCLFFFPYQPICMELPEELRQLADIQKLRREKAIKEYRMNEDGLLIRPAVELKEGDDLQKDGNYGDDGDCFPTNKVVSQITPFFNEGLLLSRKA